MEVIKGYKSILKKLHNYIANRGKTLTEVDG